MYKFSAVHPGANNNFHSEVAHIDSFLRAVVVVASKTPSPKDLLCRFLGRRLATRGGLGVRAYLFRCDSVFVPV